MIRRKRVYHILYLRERLVEAFSMPVLYQQVRSMFAGMPAADIAVLLIASPAQLCDEENRVRARRKLPPLCTCSPDWSYLLTQKQRGYKAVYERLSAQQGIDAKCIYDISQNPSKRPIVSNRSGTVPTSRRNSLLWYTDARRWLLPVEMAALHGFPVYQQHADSAGVPRDTTDYTVPMIGNSMHAGSVGCVLGVTLACLAPSCPEEACPRSSGKH